MLGGGSLGLRAPNDPRIRSGGNADLEWVQGDRSSLGSHGWGQCLS